MGSPASLYTLAEVRETVHQSSIGSSTANRLAYANQYSLICMEIHMDEIRHEPLNLKRAVVGPEMAHLVKITSAFEFSVLTRRVSRFKPPKSSKSIVLLTTCTISVHLNCSF